MDYKDWEHLMVFTFASRPGELGSTEYSAGWNKQNTRVFPEKGK